MVSFNDLIDKINVIIRNGNFIYEEFYSLLNGVGGIPIYNYTLQKGQLFYRSRLNPDSENYYSFKDLSFPDKKLVTSFGRTNRPGQNVLYLSDSLTTSLTEIIPEDFDKTIELTTAEWLVEENIEIAIIPDFDNIKMKGLLSRYINKNTKDQIDFLKIINSFFRAVTINEDNNFAYELTSAFSNARLSESVRTGHLTEGILYTSAKQNLGFNISLNPEIVANGKIRIKDIRKHYINKLGDRIIYKNENPIQIDFKKQKVEWK